jgi:hypothetical protein
MEWHAECGFFAMCKFLESRHSLRRLSVEFRRENHEISADKNFSAQIIIPRYLFLQPQVEVTLAGVDDVLHLEHHQAEEEPILHRLEKNHMFLRGLLELLSERMIGESDLSRFVPQSFGNTLSIRDICDGYYMGSEEIKDDGLVQLRFAAMLHEWRMFRQRNIAYTGVIAARDALWTAIVCSVLEHAFSAISLRRQAAGDVLGEAPMAELNSLTRS